MFSRQTGRPFRRNETNRRILVGLPGSGSQKRSVKLRAEPLLRWSDPVRHLFSDASLWAWGETGRPLAILSLECTGDEGSGRLMGARIHIARARLFELSRRTWDQRDGRQVWSAPECQLHLGPAKPGITFREIPGAAPPAQTPRLRLAQMRDLIKRFAATEHVTRQPDLLRLMPHPIDRYADPAKEQVDGAIFVFAHGTNPEAMVLIEAQGPSPEKATWRFAVARMTVAPFEVTFDRKAVWSEAYHLDAKNRPTAPYFHISVFRKAVTIGHIG